MTINIVRTQNDQNKPEEKKINIFLNESFFFSHLTKTPPQSLDNLFNEYNRIDIKNVP